MKKRNVMKPMKMAWSIIEVLIIDKWNYWKPLLWCVDIVNCYIVDWLSR